MTTPFWCLLAVAFIPYILSTVGGYFKTKQFGSLDNKSPRLQSAKLEGVGARVQAAQENAWEALAVFGTVVIVNHLAGGDPGSSATASLIYLCTRVVHPIAYIADIDKLRSGVFLVGLVSVIWLWVITAGA